MSNGQAELLVAISRVIDALQALEVDYFVGGSVASSVFGEPRQTLGADLVARLFPRHATAFVQHLGDAFYADLGAIETAIQQERSFNVIHLPTMSKVDIFTAWRNPFAQSQFAR